MFELIRRHRIAVGAGAVVLAAVGAWLAFGFFGVQALFLDDRVDDEGPTFASGAVAGVSDVGEAVPVDGAAGDPASELPGTPTAERPGTAEGPAPSDPVPTDESPAPADLPSTAEAPAPSGPGTPDEAGAAIAPPATAAPTADAPTSGEVTAASAASGPVIVTLAQGAFEGRGTYDVDGQALVLNDGTEQRFLRFEDFVADNGPDLDVYLSAAPPDAPGDVLDDDWVSLGDLRGNIGDQNYDLDPAIDLERYSTVVIWCTRFAALFGVAQLA